MLDQDTNIKTLDGNSKKTPWRQNFYYLALEEWGDDFSAVRFGRGPLKQISVQTSESCATRARLLFIFFIFIYFFIFKIFLLKAQGLKIPWKLPFCPRRGISQEFGGRGAWLPSCARFEREKGAASDGITAPKSALGSFKGRALLKCLGIQEHPLWDKVFPKNFLPLNLR